MSERKCIGKGLKDLFEPMVINKTLYIIGAGGHGCVIADIAQLRGYLNIYFIDDEKTGNHGHYEIVGRISDIKKIQYEHPEASFFVAIGNNEVRERISNELKDMDIRQPKLIHPRSVIDATAHIDEGTVIMANAVVNANAIIGRGCIINTASTIDHDCILGDFVHVSPGVHVAGTVHIGDKTWVGIGSSIINNINICSEVIIGGGTTVIGDINNSGKYAGTPARRID